MHLQMYGDLQAKKKAPRKSFVKAESKLERRYSNNNDIFVRDTLYTEYRSGIRDRKNRALKLLQVNEVELTDAPPWVKHVGEIINTANYTILGGGLKDIILWDKYAYTFYIVPNEKNPEDNWRSRNQKRYENHLEDLAERFGKLNEKVRARLNYATDDDIFATTFQMKENKKVDRRLVITKVPLCGQGTLMDYISKRRNKLGEQAFATMVYETMKVLKILHENSVYVLDIKPDNIFVCDDPRGKGYGGYTFSFGDLDMAEICNKELQFNEKVAYKACQSKLATLYFLPTNAIENVNQQRNLYGHQGYTIRDAYALSKSLLLTFNLMFAKNPRDVVIFDENKGFENWWAPQNEEEERAWEKYSKVKKETQGRRYFRYMTQDMTNEEWNDKMEKTKQALIALAAYRAPNLKRVIEALFELMYETSNSGRPVENYTRLKNWNEMVDIKTIHELMDEAKDRARDAGATTFKRNTLFFKPRSHEEIYGDKVPPMSRQEKMEIWERFWAEKGLKFSSHDMNMQQEFPMVYEEETNVEEMGVCWKGYRRNSKPRYSKGSCVKVKRRGRRRRRRFKEELKF